MIFDFLREYSLWAPMIAVALIMPFVTAPLGCVVLWQRQAFLGETLAHSALAGVALAFYLQVDPLWGVALIGALVSGILYFFSSDQRLPKDALLAMIAQGGLAIGVIVLSQIKGQRIDINVYLFGDLLTVSWKDGVKTILLALGLGVFFLLRFQGLVSYIIHKDLARIEGLASRYLPLQIYVIITLSIGLLLPILGALLLTALMIIPAAASRMVSRTPLQMIFYSFLFSVMAIVGGFFLSFATNLPTSPVMVCISILLFILVKCRKTTA
jgi:zinc transport system permease protein